MVHWGVGILAVVLIAVVLQDAFEVMLLPRRVARRWRLSRFYYDAAWRGWTAVARRLPGGGREDFLSTFGALSMVVLFVLWSGSLVVGFGLLRWAVQPAGASAGGALCDQIYASGAAFFTLGYSDDRAYRGIGRFMAVIEAGSGLGFIAVVIGYLPVLYQFFSRREAHVIQLDGRAGSPPTAATMLVRHAEAAGLDRLDEFLRAWEVWGSEMLESHLSYPMLAFYRSQHENQSWLAAIGCMMDVCALILVGGLEFRPLQARMTFTMARQVLVELTRSFGVGPSRYDGGDRLDHAAYARLRAVLAGAGLGWGDDPQTEESLAALRATYEPLLDGLSRYLLLPLPNWTAEGDRPDNWKTGHRGMIAARLIAQLTERAAPGQVPDIAVPVGRRWRRLRARLRNR